MMSMQLNVLKRHDPKDRTMNFVKGRDDLDPLASDDSDDELGAEMSCGHVFSPVSLTEWCISKLKEGIYEFRCPAVVTGTTLCGERWSYREVRLKAALHAEEMQYFEKTMSHLIAADSCEIHNCPQCKTYVERKDLSNLCVVCTICKADRAKVYMFCWQCNRPWKGPGPRSDRCDNDGCTNKDLELLQTCKTITLPRVQEVTCPAIRACPTCGMKVEHNRKHCKTIDCRRCHVVFCFVCLKLKSECCKTSSPYTACSSGVAPRQTSIPVWRKK